LPSSSSSGPIVVDVGASPNVAGRQRLASIPGVRDVHDLHVWSMGAGETALSAHMGIASGDAWPGVLAAAQRRMRDEFCIHHLALQPDWPRPPRPAAQAWRRSVEALSASLVALAAAIDSLPADRLAARVGQASRPLGTGVTIAEMLSGIVQHTAYHSGQIALLRKGLESD